MRYVLPAVLFAVFATMVVLSPHVEPRRLRARSALVDARLRVDFGFTDGSRAAWAGVQASGWPPFHYGKHQQIDSELMGTVDGVPVRVAGYECVIAGSRHRYELASVVLPAPVEWAEVRGEPAFSAPRVPDHVPDGRRIGALPEFNEAYEAFAEEQEAAMLVGSAATANVMLQVPEPFSWRALDSEVLLWKRGGWSSADTLIASVRAVLEVFDPVIAVNWRG
jgi:hypothetical protein